MSEKYLFVGGPADGERREARNERQVVALWRSHSLAGAKFQRSNFGIGESPVEEHVYIADKFVAGDSSTLIYRHSSLSGEDAFRLILENYRPAK